MINNFMNSKEAALFLDCTDRNITGLCNKGEFIGATKDGSMWYIPKETLEIYKMTHPKNKKKRSRSTSSKKGAEVTLKGHDAEIKRKAIAENAATQAGETAKIIGGDSHD